MKTMKQTLIDTLEDKLNEMGIGRVYELNVTCNACPFCQKCVEVNGLETWNCTEFIEKIWKGEIK